MMRLAHCLSLYGWLLTAQVEAEITADQRAQLGSVQKLVKSGKMPPRSKGFPPQQFKILTDWIEQGAKFDGHDQKADLRSLKLATDE